MSNNVQMKSNAIYIALGANLPSGVYSPAQTLQSSIEVLEAHDIRVCARSAFWTSPAWPDPSNPPYVNAVVEVETELAPRALLDLLHKVETQFGRTRVVRWASRTLDLDLLDYRGEVLSDDSGLVLPHPRINERAFVLLPLREVATHWQCPRTGVAIDDLIKALPAEARSAMERMAPHAGRATETLAINGAEE